MVYSLFYTQEGGLSEGFIPCFLHSEKRSLRGVIPCFIPRREASKGGLYPGFIPRREASKGGLCLFYTQEGDL